MSNSPVFNQVNLVVADMDRALAFYRLLGVDLDDSFGEWPPGSGARHVHADESEPAGFDLDNTTMARLWGHDALEPGEAIIGFDLATPEAVDDTYHELTVAGFTGRREPYDAFFGARYAIVEDPDGRPVGLMGPRDIARRYTPTTER
jgi:catechol 2,3-dioxygenase-like lactoylglutathione lyase family enzyme